MSCVLHSILYTRKQKSLLIWYHTKDGSPISYRMCFAASTIFQSISGTAEIIQTEEELDALTNMVEYSGTSEIVGNDLELHIADLSVPAAPLALEYVVTEVPQNCKNRK